MQTMLYGIGILGMLDEDWIASAILYSGFIYLSKSAQQGFLMLY
jgi:hypothetical protein